MKRILINAVHSEETRVAIVANGALANFDIERKAAQTAQGNIYKARVCAVKRDLEAAFVEYGTPRQGLLSLRKLAASDLGKISSAGTRVKIDDALKAGQQLLVQISKDAREGKGASLTTEFSIAGRYIVIKPNSPTGGVSLKMNEEGRTQMREILSQLNLADGTGVIIRSAALGRTKEELQRDYDELLKLWKEIEAAGKAHSAPKLIYQENSLVLRIIRDKFTEDVKEVLVDDSSRYNEIIEYVKIFMPELKDRVRLYDEPTPLFSKYQIENQIIQAFDREVSLPSGGTIAIDPTEALVAIDVNSAKSKSGNDLEQAALNTNLEAVDEITHQLQLRDIGGLIVIDFIDMDQLANRQTVENRMAAALSEDHANISWTRISRFGLMELQRQRLQPALHETFFETCPQCEGHGRIRNVDSIALSILRKVEHIAGTPTCSSVQAHTPPEVATYLLNEKRQDVELIEERTGVHVMILPQENLNRPDYKVLQFDENGTVSNYTIASYEHPIPPEERLLGRKSNKKSSSDNLMPVVSLQSHPTNDSIKGNQRKKTKGKTKTDKRRQEPLLRRVLARMFSSKPEPVTTNPQKRKNKRKEDHKTKNEKNLTHKPKQRANKAKQNKESTDTLQNTNKQQHNQQNSQQQRKRQAQTIQKSQKTQKSQKQERDDSVQTVDSRKSRERTPKKIHQSNRHTNNGQSSHRNQRVDTEDQVKGHQNKSRKTDTQDLETKVSSMHRTNHTNKRQRNRAKRTSAETEPSVVAIFNEWNKESSNKDVSKSMPLDTQSIEEPEPIEEVTMTKTDRGTAVSSEPGAQTKSETLQKTNKDKHIPQHERACNDPRKHIDQVQLPDTKESHSNHLNKKVLDSSVQFPAEHRPTITVSAESSDTEQKNSGSDQEETLANIQEHTSHSTLDWEPQNPGIATNENANQRAKNDPRLRNSP